MTATDVGRAPTAHRCARRHRTWTALANCMFPRAGWISGDGPVAVVVGCGVSHVTLYATARAAQAALAELDEHGCGGRCVGDHAGVLLDLGTSS